MSRIYKINKIFRMSFRLNRSAGPVPRDCRGRARQAPVVRDRQIANSQDQAILVSMRFR